MKIVKLVSFAITALLITQFTTSTFAKDQTLANPSKWQSSELANHDLVGKIWSTEKSAFISPEELKQALLKKRFVLLGEIHDNPDHHWLQAQIINFLATQSTKQRPALVVEMIKVDQMPRLEAYRKQTGSKAKFLGTALQWKQNGWPDWSIYQPIGEQIFTHNLEVYPGHTTRMMIDHLIKSDMSILPAKAKKIFKLDIELDKELNNALSNDIRISHCNKLPEHVIPPMTVVQRFRDAWMADVMIQASYDDKDQRRQAILIAGTGHTRTDRGAPWYLNLREGKGNSISIQFAETIEKATSIKDVAQADPKGNIAADYIWVTPTIKRGDPCKNIPDFGKKE